MKSRIITVLAALAVATGLMFTAASASVRSTLDFGPCGYPNIADIKETYGSYAVGFAGTGTTGSTAIEVAKPGWDICTYQHPDGSWNLYLYNGNEIGANSTCTQLESKAAGSSGTAWTEGGYGPDHYIWESNYCAGYGGPYVMAGANNGTALQICGEQVGCSFYGLYIHWTDAYE